jgi:hypothetical protein
MVIGSHGAETLEEKPRKYSIVGKIALDTNFAIEAISPLGEKKKGSVQGGNQ